MSELLALAGVVVVSCWVGTLAGHVTYVRWTRWQQHRETARETARREDLRQRAIALRDEKRAAGEQGVVLVDNAAGTVEWMPASAPFLGPAGKA